MVGIATFDSTIHFYNLKRALQQVNMTLCVCVCVCLIQVYVDVFILLRMYGIYEREQWKFIFSVFCFLWEITSQLICMWSSKTQECFALLSAFVLAMTYVLEVLVLWYPAWSSCLGKIKDVHHCLVQSI